MDEAIEKSAMRKVYMRLLPFAILSYFLAYIVGDRASRQ
jgi:ACS family tartrate transporter-like MFS transporter